MQSPKEYLQTITRAALKRIADFFSSFFTALSHAPGQIIEGFKEAVKGVGSHDRPTRRMSWFFFFSFVLVLLALGGVGKYWLAIRAKEQQEVLALEQKKKEEKLRAEELRKSREPPPYQSLGTFSLEIREQDGVAKSSGLRAAEMEIVLACSDLSVCEWIKNHIDLSRGELSPLFTATDREKILSPNGKKAFREEIRDVLNHLLEERSVHGVIIEVLFPRFIIS